jgi:hypothetical protein
VDLREPFLIAVARRLRDVPIGDGSLRRICRDLQREFFDPPMLERTDGTSKYR